MGGGASAGAGAESGMSVSTGRVLLTSVELNLLIFRYLHESCLTHSAFCLGYEAGIDRYNIDGNIIPPGALVTIVQKGLQYIEMEANLDEDDYDIHEDLSVLQPIDLITKSVDELQDIVRRRKKQKILKEQERDREKRKDKGSVERSGRQGGEHKENKRHDKDKKQEREKEKIEINQEQVADKEKGNQLTEHADRNIVTDDGVNGVPNPMDIQMTVHEISSSEVTILEGHTSEVFACAWSPVGSLLATGSGDSTARIWTIPESACGSAMQSLPINVHSLKHFKGRANEKSKDVTTLDWSGDGTLLATGSYDGQARVWTRDGDLRATLAKHKGPIFSLKWNKSGDLLLSGSVDKTAIVWDTSSWDCRQQFECHSAPMLDVDWRNNNSFATCSSDKMIYLCKVGDSRPIKSFGGHEGEVNAIKWDPTGTLLASCSDDGTAKIWSLKQDKYLHNFREHTKEIYTIRWSPTGPGTNNPNQQLVLASASFDSTIKLWDAEQGRLLFNLNEHKQPVYSVAFSPNGRYLASGSLDQCLNIWSVEDGRILKTYRKGGGGIFEVCWNREGDKIAACFANSTVCVMDFRM